MEGHTPLKTEFFVGYKNFKTHKHTFKKRSFLGLLLLPLFLIPFLSHPASAAEPSMSVSTSGSVDINVSGGTSSISSSSVHVTTGCRAGYNLTLNTSVNDNELYLNGNSSSTHYFAPTNGKLNESPNTWGYFITTPSSTPTSNSVFHPVPSLGSTPAFLKTTTETASEQDIDETFSVYYGANAASIQAGGTYRLKQDTNNSNAYGALTYALTVNPYCVVDIDVSFNKNLDGAGGETPLDPEDIVSNFPVSSDNTIDFTNRTLILSDKTPTRPDYVFKEWNTEPDGTGDYYYPGDVINIGTEPGELTGDIAMYAIWTPEGSIVLNYDGNGLYYNDDPSDTTNQVIYQTTREIVTKYVHTANVSDEGIASGTYASNLNTTDTVTIDGATSLNVTIYYDAESTTYDWVSVYQSPFDISDDNDATASITTGNLSGKLSGRNSSRTTSYTSWYSRTYTVSGDTAKFHFKSDSGGNYYGYYAIVTGNVSTEATSLIHLSGTYKTPSSNTPHIFLGWSEDQNATTPTYTDEEDLIANATYTRSDSSVTLYAVHASIYTVTVNLDEHSQSVTLSNPYVDTQEVVNPNVGSEPYTSTVNLVGGITYDIATTFDAGYRINAWSTAEGGTIGDIASANTTFIATDTTTLSLTSTSTSTLLPGTTLNTTMKTLAEGTDTSYDDSSSKIKALRMADSLPDNFTPSSDNTVSTDDSDKPIYIFFDNTDDAGIMYFYTEAKKIFMNINSDRTFYNDAALTDISALAKWDTSKVTDMEYMFYNASSLTNIDALAKWDTSKVTDMESMFSGASSLANIDGASNWDISSVANMPYMFVQATSLTNIDGASNWDTSNVTDMEYMFYNATSLTNIDGASKWNTSKVTDMEKMFYYATSLTNIDGASNWSTGNVTDMSYMFYHATSLTNIDALSNWDTSRVTYMQYMFSYATSLTNIDGASNWNTSKVKYIYFMFSGARSLTNIDGASNWDTSRVTDMEKMFYDTTSLTNIDGASNWDTSRVTDMKYMFYNATSLTNIDGASKWDTGKVTNMQYMFAQASSLTNIDGAINWNTGSVNDMQYMFSYATSLTNIDGASKWNTSNVTNMMGMFFQANKLTNIDGASNWSTGNVTDMSYMFYYATSLANTSSINDWDINSVGKYNFTFMFRSVPTHPNFTKRAGTWDNSGTFTPSS